MTVFLSLALALLIAFIGFVILPLLGIFVMLYQAVLGFVVAVLRSILAKVVPDQTLGVVAGALNWFLGYMVGRYVMLLVEALLLALAIGALGGRFGLITWPAWLVAGWCIYLHGSALINYDLDLYLRDPDAEPHSQANRITVFNFFRRQRQPDVKAINRWIGFCEPQLENFYANRKKFQESLFQAIIHVMCPIKNEKDAQTAAQLVYFCSSRVALSAWTEVTDSAAQFSAQFRGRSSEADFISDTFETAKEIFLGFDWSAAPPEFVSLVIASAGVEVTNEVFQGRYSSALEIADDAISRWPRSRETASLIRQRGIVNLALRNYAGAIADLTDAIYRDPELGSVAEPLAVAMSLESPFKPEFRVLCTWVSRESKKTIDGAVLNSQVLLFKGIVESGIVGNVGVDPSSERGSKIAGRTCRLLHGGDLAYRDDAKSEDESLVSDAEKIYNLIVERGPTELVALATLSALSMAVSAFRAGARDATFAMTSHVIGLNKTGNCAQVAEAYKIRGITNMVFDRLPEAEADLRAAEAICPTLADLKKALEAVEKLRTAC